MIVDIDVSVQTDLTIFTVFKVSKVRLLLLQGLFGEEEDSETSMYFPQSSNLFRTDRDVRFLTV